MNKTLFSIILLLLPIHIFSQGGSNYSIFGIGDIIYGQSAASQAMGGAQIAVPSKNTINMLNPALWGMVNTTRVQTGYRFNQNYIESAESSLLQNNGTINGFYSIFNFDPVREISAALLFQPISSVNYYMSTPISMPDNDLDVVGDKIYKGSGGLSNLTFGLGTKIINGVYIGASVSAIIGKIDHNIRTNITTAGADNYQISNNNVFSGLNGSIGVLFVPIDNLCVGAFYQMQNEASVENRMEYIYVPASSFLRDTALVKDIKQQLPNFFGVGASYTFGRYLLAADALFGNFSDVQTYQSDAVGEFSNSSKFSLGLSILGNQNPYASLVSRASYKVGAYYEKMYYNIDSKQVIEYAITGGLQFPISRTAQLDFSLALGRRGTNDALINETFGRIIIEISIGDTWFKPVRNEY
ncbi:MAG: hypothetical protein LBO69_07940 [Ignavibacteria bacterium]|jgi:hypothetical protein|nr:hypothetical protein [Ignavibacteria bacterium]